MHIFRIYKKLKSTGLSGGVARLIVPGLSINNDKYPPSVPEEGKIVTGKNRNEKIYAA